MKQYFVVLILSVFSIAAFGQKKMNRTMGLDSLAPIKLKSEPRFYFNIHGGYSYGLGSTFKFYPDDISSISVQQIESSPQAKSVRYREKSKGLGEGFRVGIGLQYIINDFINIGLDVDYFKSTISKVKDSVYKRVLTTGGNVDELNYNEKYKISYEATLITFTPNITFKAISRPKFFIYNKIGAVVIFRPNSIQKETQEGNYRMGWQGFFRDSSANTQKRYEWGIKNPALGFMGGIGAQLKLTERIRSFVELQFTHVVFKVRDRVLTNYTVQGKEMVSTLPLSAKEIQFKQNFNSEDQTNDPNRPTIAIYQRFPITYVGVQAGIAYRF